MEDIEDINISWGEGQLRKNDPTRLLSRGDNKQKVQKPEVRPRVSSRTRREYLVSTLGLLFWPHIFVFQGAAWFVITL